MGRTYGLIRLAASTSPARAADTAAPVSAKSAAVAGPTGPQPPVHADDTPTLFLVEVLGTRAKAQPPPSHVVFEALMSPNLDPDRQWLRLLDDEVLPRIAESARPTLVVWSSIWVKRPAAQIRFDIQGDGPGCHVRWTLLDTQDPGPALVGHMRKRLNVLINAELRYSFGQ